MRVRYQKINQSTQAECDLTEKQAKRIFSDLKQDSLCLWAELVGEDEDNYMEILDQFDQDKEVIKAQRMLEEICKEVRA